MDFFENHLIDKGHDRAHQSYQHLLNIGRYTPDKDISLEQAHIRKIRKKYYKVVKKESKQHRNILNKLVYWHFLWLFPVRRKSTFPKTMTPMQYLETYHVDLLYQDLEIDLKASEPPTTREMSNSEQHGSAAASPSSDTAGGWPLN